jgi:hypothetical protein
MPNPSDFSDQESWMAACVPARTGEGDEHDQAVAACLDIWQAAHKAVDLNVGGGVDRDKLAASDFVFQDERKFPVKIPKDVKDAMSSWGRYKGTKTFEQFKRRLIALAKRKGNEFVTALPNAWKEEKNTLKALSRNAAEIRVGNYIVLFGGRDLEGLASDAKNGDGSIGEYFTAETELESSYTKSGQIAVDWEHGVDGIDDVLGYVDWGTAKTDARGVWVMRVLDRHNKYA